jgi:hypothetical protein
MNACGAGMTTTMKVREERRRVWVRLLSNYSYALARGLGWVGCVAVTWVAANGARPRRQLSCRHSTGWKQIRFHVECSTPIFMRKVLNGIWVLDVDLTRPQVAF